MSGSASDRSASGEARERFVLPFYMSLLNASFLRDDDAAAFRQRFGEAARAITDEELQALLDERNWRHRLAAAWLIGVSGRQRFIEPCGELLLASELCYAGQGYCVALGLLGGDRSVHQLEMYLRKYLPFEGRHFDQYWAIAALAHIAPESARELLREDLWPASAEPGKTIALFAGIVRRLRKYGLVAG